MSTIFCRLFHWLFGGWSYEGWMGGCIVETHAVCRRCGRRYAREENMILETDTGWTRKKG